MEKKEELLSAGGCQQLLLKLCFHTDQQRTVGIRDDSPCFLQYFRQDHHDYQHAGDGALHGAAASDVLPVWRRG